MNAFALALPDGAGRMGAFGTGSPGGELDDATDDLAQDAGELGVDGLDEDTLAKGAPTHGSVAPPAPDDAQLEAWIERIVDHDERALSLLYDATFARLYALVLRIVQRASIAEEVVEDTFWQVWRQAPRFDAARGRALTWLMAMARSRAIDALRRDQRFRHAALPEDDQIDGEVGAACAPPDLLEATRSEHRLHQALAQLDVQPRQLIALAFFRGLTHEEIAAQTALPLGTVKSQIRRSLQVLKNLLGDEDMPIAPKDRR